MSNFLRICMVSGDAVSKFNRDFCMDLEPCFKVHYLVVYIQLNNTKLGQMTNLNVIFLWWCQFIN